MSNSIHSLIRPPQLKQGDVVGVVAPAGPVDKKQLETGLAVIRAMGFEPLLGRYVYARSRYMAGPDHDRAQDLMDMFQTLRCGQFFVLEEGMVPTAFFLT